ncbi:methyl-CpG-binding domain protein 1 isoform X15 [Ovis aries]|uniref:methyl-CpG-binding domain protein 1 isoform X15 n=1 Tax=Ovis aries TaxID=9940 RepID=UPI001C2E7363|nr:methyl-CpG-binding domain protein 1 isoform X15 [Ovis aries]
MAEDWLDCPALGPGWKRREVFRKSGATCGRSDTYYQSPTGDRIRSKVELTRYLGPACDLTLFDFKQGVLCYPSSKAHSLAITSRKRKKPSKPAKARKCQVGPQKSEVRKEAPRDDTKADTDTVPASLPAPGCCENCGISFSGDGTRRQRLKTLCKDCRAQRIAFNREQRMFKRVGCGECTACQVKEDCGACSTCLLQLPHDVASGLFCKCERRRCLRIVERSRGCGVCRGCQTREDCGRCRVCLRPPRPGLRRQWKCVQRRCLRHLAHRLRRHHQRCQRRPPLAVAPPAGKHGRRRGGCDSKVVARRRPPRAQSPPPPPPPQPPESPELHPRALAPSPPAEFIYYCVDEDELQPYTNRRQNRKCGACAACLRRTDCGHCDFCCDKPKFGGSNQKRQKCRWRQCLQFAMAVDPGLPSVKQEPPDPEEEKDDDKADSTSDLAPEEEAGGAGTPVITEIFSLGGTRLRDTAVWLPSPPRRNQTCASHKLVPPVAVVGEPRRTPSPIRGSSKMYSQRFGIVQREVKGPTPKVVIVSTGFEYIMLRRMDWHHLVRKLQILLYSSRDKRAKPPKVQGAEHHLERIQHSHQKHHAILASIKSIERDRLKTEWQQHNDRKFVDSLVKARVKDAMQGFIINTEERRNKLRELLASEENEYFTEMQLKEETIEEKKDRMRDKIRLLREKKEKERQDFVAEKLDQQFRERCQELRTELFCIHQKAVCEDRKAQIAFNEELKRQKVVEEQMFSKLWEEDRLAKERREAKEERRQKELVENTRLGLNAQVTSIQAQRQAAQRLREEEARLVENENARVKLENEQDKLKKQKTKQEIRIALQKALQEKMERMQQEYREEQDLNMKLMQNALQNLQDETDKKKQKKEDMRREQKIYYQYLAQRHEEEKAQEKELDRMLEKEKEKKFAEKDKELRLEKEARKQLLNEVMCTRKLQVQEKLQRKAKEQEERTMEQERINEGLRELNCEERENFTRRCSLAQEYRKQLQMQICSQQQAREAEKEEERREFEAGIAAEKNFQDKIQEILSTHPVVPRNIHPMRRACPTKLPP